MIFNFAVTSKLFPSPRLLSVNRLVMNDIDQNNISLVDVFCLQRIYITNAAGRFIDHWFVIFLFFSIGLGTGEG